MEAKCIVSYKKIKSFNRKKNLNLKITTNIFFLLIHFIMADLSYEMYLFVYLFKNTLNLLLLDLKWNRKNKENTNWQIKQDMFESMCWVLFLSLQLFNFVKN